MGGVMGETALLHSVGATMNEEGDAYSYLQFTSSTGAHGLIKATDDTLTPLNVFR